MMMMEEMGRGFIDEYSPTPFEWEAKSQIEKKSGFAVTIVGYSPYGKSVPELYQLMDPAKVTEDPSTWGFITRLERLDDMVADGNSPFELYKKSNPEQFKLDIKEVDLATEYPPQGVGVFDSLYRNKIAQNKPVETYEWILIDPLTKETISKISKLDRDGREMLDPTTGETAYQINDHWFVLNLKLVWRNAPKPPESATQGTTMGYYR
jgi:hypothetical protein